MTRITIDDDMVERAARAVFGQSSLEQGSFWGIANPRAAFRTALEAALDRRTGPKDRRAEWDDTYQVLNRRCHPYAGRRKDGADYVLLPRKSDRLKREAEAKAQEIHVSDAMVSAGLAASGLCFSGAFRTFEAYRNAYRAMRLQEMKERGQ